MLGLACSPASCPHAVRQQTPAVQLASTGRPAASAAAAPAACLLPHHRQRRRQAAAPARQRRRSAAAGAALDEVGASSERGGAADGLQPPSGSGSDADLEGATQDYLRHCQQQYGKEGLIEFSAGVNNLPRVALQHPAGARCELYLHGGAVTSWRHSDGRELLHLREGNTFNGSDAINGGIQIAWPQYGVGALPTNGFLQNLHWSVVETCWREPEEGQKLEGLADLDTIMDWRPTVSLYADTDDEWAEKWPHKFEALYTITLMQPDPKQPTDAEFAQQAMDRYRPWLRRRQQQDGVAGAAAAAAEEEGRHRQRQRQGQGQGQGSDAEQPPATPSVLRCLLQVHNSDEQPFTFTTGLRTHFATKDISTHGKFVKTLGLKGKYALDYSGNPLRPRLGVEGRDHVFFADMAQMDSIYVDCEADGDVMFCPGSPSHFHIHNKQGFSDIGLVHPAASATQEARRFVCMASARAVRKVTLQPGETWVGEMVLTAHDRYWDLPAWEVEDPSGVPIPEQSPDLLPPRRPLNWQSD